MVLAERNWNAQSGLIDTPFDRGGNVAAELGLRMARNLVERESNAHVTQESSHAQNP